MAFFLALSPGCLAQAAEEQAPVFNWQPGPASIPLQDQAVLKLPQGYSYLASAQAIDLLRRMGNSPSDNTLGLVISNKDEGKWFLVLSYYPSGYIKDDDAKDWDAGGMLKAMQEGTAADNARRKQMGISEMFLTGWAEKPHYDKTSNKLVWAVSNKTSKAEEGEGVNFNTLSLGRHGYISMNMVTDLGALPQYKPQVQTMLAGLEFVQGKRYAEFNSATDKIAAVGLTALVAGTAAKLGLFSKLGAFLLPILLAAKKFLVAIVIALGALVSRLFKRKPAKTA